MSEGGFCFISSRGQKLREYYNPYVCLSLVAVPPRAFDSFSAVGVIGQLWCSLTVGETG